MLRSIALQKEGEMESSSSVIFEKNDHYLGGILSDDPSRNSYASVNFLGKPLVIYNIEKLTEIGRKITHLSFPVGMSEQINKVAENFPDLQIDEYSDPSSPGTSDALRIPLNSLITKSLNGEFAVSSIVYPWDILTAMEYVLETDVRTKSIAKDVSIEAGSVIDGPCLIESGVSVDSFCKIKGPVYIGPGCKIGTGSLVRNTMMGTGCITGFSCEVARSYISGFDTFPHYDAILDSVVGEHTWMGGYVAITNVMLNNKQVRYRIDGKLVETGLSHFGAVIGHNCTIGAAVVILPGRFMPPRSFVPPHVLFSSAEELQPRGP
jgi:UDP-N-acetylglucosamine diphosphorylase / glucose-1-phosphate thymidylyltransferase / UDP-N-acetylgalactosamine diphosphorylase / glucosamine-1-phosphate N-acetyltransferase / galactosamine-1-phosphate N-acetyltransferase